MNMVIYLSVEVKNNTEFIVWRTISGTAIATLCNTTKGGYLVNTIRVASRDMKHLTLFLDFNDLNGGINNTENYIKKEFGDCHFLTTKSYTNFAEKL